MGINRARRGGLATSRKYGASIYKARAAFLGEKVPKSKVARNAQTKRFWRKIKKEGEYYPKTKKYHLKFSPKNLFFHKKNYRGIAAVLILVENLKGKARYTMADVRAADWDKMFGPDNETTITVEYKGHVYTGIKRVVSTTFLKSYDEAHDRLHDQIAALGELPSASDTVLLDEIYEVA